MASSTSTLPVYDPCVFSLSTPVTGTMDHLRMPGSLGLLQELMDPRDLRSGGVYRRAQA